MVSSCLNPDYNRTLKKFGHILSHYKKAILESGLLLDDDLEVLLSYSECPLVGDTLSNDYQKYILTGGAITLGGLLLCKLCHKPLYILPALSIVGGIVIRQVKKQYCIERHKNNIEEVIKYFQKTYKLNFNVIHYFKIRNEISSTKDEEFFASLTSNVRKLLEILSNQQFDLLRNIKDCLKHFSVLVPQLQDDYIFLENVSIKELDVNQLENLETCLIYLRRHQDILTLFISKFLGYLGILVSLSTINNFEAEHILNTVVPKTLATVKNAYESLKLQFDKVRYSANKMEKAKKEIRLTEKKLVSNKLHQTLVYTVTNLSIILEKSQGILDKYETINSEKQLKEIGISITDLRDHTYATYESLDVLCKLYGILSNSIVKQKQSKDAVENLPHEKEKRKEDKELPVVNFDDENEESEDLKYELYIGENDPDEMFTTSYEENQPGAYLSLMLKELKQSLKQHQRFIAARTRRGSTENDVEDIQDVSREIVKTRPPSPPKFDLSFRNEACKIPVPPPPPPPPRFISQLEDNDSRPVRGLVDNIKALSSQREVKEEVFGDSDCDDLSD